VRKIWAAVAVLTVEAFVLGGLVCVHIWEWAAVAVVGR